jgi:hypothetical protein
MATRKRKWTEWVSYYNKNIKDTDSFIVCFDRHSTRTREELDTLVAACNDRLGAPLVRHENTYAGDVFEMPWGYRDRAFLVMETLLRAGLSFRTQTRIVMYIQPSDLPEGVTFAPEILEHMVVKYVRESVERAFRDFWKHESERVRWWKAVDMICERDGHIYSHESAWLTEEGRELVRWLVDKNPLNQDSSDEEVRLSTPPKRPRDELESDEVPPSKVPRIITINDEDGTLCTVCLEVRADTMALPCEHQVVCRACSEKLKATANARSCVYCRQGLTEVVMDSLV